VVDSSSFIRVGSVFHARGSATEKVLTPIRRRVRGTTRSPDDEARSAVEATGNESVPIQLAQCRFPGLAISNVKI